LNRGVLAQKCPNLVRRSKAYGPDITQRCEDAKGPKDSDFELRRSPLLSPKIHQQALKA